MPWKDFPIALPEQALKLIHMIDDENFKFCLDTGHASVYLPYTYDPRIKASVKVQVSVSEI